MMSQCLDVEIFADIICPWCYIGKKRLDAAFIERPQITPRYIWRCFLLNPSMPEDGMSRQAYLLANLAMRRALYTAGLQALAAKAALISILIRSKERQIAARHIAIYWPPPQWAVI